MDRRVTDQLATKVAVLEERMNTKHQEYKTDIARLAAQLANRDRAIILAVFSMMALGIAILRFTD